MAWCPNCQEIRSRLARVGGNWLLACGHVKKSEPSDDAVDDALEGMKPYAEYVLARTAELERQGIPTLTATDMAIDEYFRENPPQRQCHTDETWRVWGLGAP